MKKLINMKYSSAILTFLTLSTIVIILLLYFANITRKIEKENFTLNNQINIIKDQLNINEIEYNIYNNYEYLVKMKKLYFDNNININYDNRISFNDLESKNLNDFIAAGIR